MYAMYVSFYIEVCIIQFFIMLDHEPNKGLQR